ncbi:Aste57867_5232 [Aphanomyces stellatus]|uniref:Aste57867_5232 protein n=1 Tax=Aphanomyces stellatus TaxID=120398 RepID=A0A485KEE0_9STRA|nr:hypothetical protein As57867_005219 [Aphanomyces stellatus]VFT82305.1 Aste57867_5232 [Aphanomyces stellatus]
MTKTSYVPLLRVLQFAVSLVAMVALSGVFQPVTIRGQPAPILETSYAINVAVMLASVAMIYSGLLFAISHRCSRVRVGSGSTVELLADIGIALLLLLAGLVLADSDDLKHCHESINVRCDRFVAAIALTLVASLLFGATVAVVVIEGGASETPEESAVATPVACTTPKDTRFGSAALPTKTV